MRFDKFSFGSIRIDGVIHEHDVVIDGCKIPRYLKVTEQFPMTVTGKVQKFRIRAISIEEFGLQNAAEIQTA
jgi:hypothetical protein